MATYIVSGAGDSSYNGTYVESGTFHSRPAFTNGSRWLYFAGGPFSLGWVLGPACEENQADEKLPAAATAYCNGMAIDVPLGQYQVFVGTAPAPTVSEQTSWLKIGVDDDDSALWNNAVKHRYSKFGATGGYEDTETETEGMTRQVPIRWRAPSLTGGDTYKAILKVGEHIWNTISGLGGLLEETLQSAFTSLPYSWNGLDDWASWLAAGATNFTVELRRESDNELVASDEAAWTVFVPQVVIASPSPGTTVGDVFTAIVKLSEWHAGALNVTFALGQGAEGTSELYNTSIEIDDEANHEVTIDAIRWRDALGLTARLLANGPFTLRALAAPLAYAEIWLTAAIEYELNIETNDNQLWGRQGQTVSRSM